MILDRNLPPFRDIYDNEDGTYRKAIDAAFNAAHKSLKDSGFKCAGDDRAENLVTAIVKYVEVSGPTVIGVMPAPLHTARQRALGAE